MWKTWFCPEKGDLEGVSVPQPSRWRTDMRKTKNILLPLALVTLCGVASAQETAPEPGTVLPDAVAMAISGEGIVPFRCPIEQIRNAYQNLVNPDDTLMALAIEKQTLAICRQSQEALIRIAENEMRLRELFEPIMAPPLPPAAPPPIAQIIAPDPARNVMETIPLAPLPLTEEGIEAGAEIVVGVGVEAPPAAPETDFVLGVLMRDPEGRKAILVRGEEMFTVRQGEEVTEGVRVTEIDDARVTIQDPDGNIFILE